MSEVGVNIRTHCNIFLMANTPLKSVEIGLYSNLAVTLEKNTAINWTSYYSVCKIKHVIYWSTQKVKIC